MALDNQDRTVRMTKQIGHGNENMTTNTGQRGKRAGDKNAGAGQLGQESLGRTARTGQP